MYTASPTINIPHQCGVLVTKDEPTQDTLPTRVYSEGSQNMSPQNMWHKDYFELQAVEKQTLKVGHTFSKVSFFPSLAGRTKVNHPGQPVVIIKTLTILERTPEESK